MNDTTHFAGKQVNRMPSIIAFPLFLAGMILPLLCWIFWLPKVLLFVACGVEVLALVLAVLSRWHQLSKVTITGIMGFCLLSIWLERGRFPTYPLKIHPTAVWMKPLDSRWVLQSAGKSHSIRTSSGITKNGEDSLRFELRGGEAWVDQTFIPTFRAEVATREFVPAGSVKWYGFSVCFPTNMPLEDKWLCFVQWKYDESLSEGLRRRGLRPGLRFGYRNGRFDVETMHSSDLSIRDPDAIAEETLFKKNHFPLGQWHDFVVQAKWSCKDNGFINIWWNGRQIVEYRGPVGYEENMGPQFKFGLYHDDSDKAYVAYFNHVKSGDTPKDVDFDPSLATRYQEK